MNDKLDLEKEIILEKRKKINGEIREKLKTQEEIEKRLKFLTKEARGSYNQDKENTERIYNLIKKDISNFEEILKKPYFGKVDFAEKFGTKESIYIGKYGVSSSMDGEEIVVDWRAPVADLYYNGTGGEAYYKAPMGIIEGELYLKRKFLYSEDNNINRVFDESTNELIINGEEGTDLVDEFLKINLEESRGKKLKEVVATIQKEQNEIIRWPKNLPIIVQGSAGSGKTTIALHRLAYLLYRYRESITGKDILVLAPNKLFIDYISEILPNLGSEDVVQTTFQELAIKELKLKAKIKSKDEKLKDIIESNNIENKDFIIKSSRIKGSLEFKNIINRYITLLESSSIDIEDIVIKGYILFSKREIIRLYLKDLKNFPINRRKDEIKRYLNLKIKEKIQMLLLQVDKEWQEKINKIKSTDEDSEERRRKLIYIYTERDKIKEIIKSESKRTMSDYFKAWRGITSKDIYLEMFRDETIFNIAIDNKIPHYLVSYMKEHLIDNHNNNIIDEEDLAPLLYIHSLLEGIDDKSKFKHIVVDEAQDYSPFQISLINNLSKGNSLTLVGDLAQGIYYYKGITRWEDITEDIFENKASYISLSQSYRSTVEIINFAKGPLNAQNLSLVPAKPVLRHGPKPKIIYSSNKKESIKLIRDSIQEIIDSGKNSIAIITRTLAEAKDLEKDIKKYSDLKLQVIKGNEKESSENILIIPSYLTKGLEFDGTIVYNPLKDNYEDDILNQRLLYVALTRALHYQYLIAEGELSMSIIN